MRLGIVLLALSGCADGCGPPDYALRGVCASQIPVGTPVVVTPLALTDVQEGTKASRPAVFDLAWGNTDFVTATLDGSTLTLLASRPGTGYLQLDMGSPPAVTATFVIQAGAAAGSGTAASSSDEPCETLACGVREH